MPEKPKILVVDDEPQITRALSISLSTHGYDVQVASDGDFGLNIFHDWVPDLVITDLSMPNMTGIELCVRIRSRSQTPIIILSVKGDEKNKIEALDLGADDYVTKPFSIQELLARIRVNLRRMNQLQEPQLTEPIQVGDFRVDPETRMVFVCGKEVRLTPKAYELLVYMVRHPGKVLTHRVLLNAVWGGQRVQQPEYLRVFINQLRHKIEPGEKPIYILTEPWVGYRFQPGGEAAPI